ncbi:MAG: DUF501 domain-containing protein [Frankiaceae bacterium]|jgi:hypothetical protein|nr:DUF501 domain-containing protein [Frankiaceae bacterium]
MSASGSPGPGRPGLDSAGPAVLDPLDRAVVARQLGREPRALRQVAHRCPCGNPDVVQTAPELADGTPFPTLFYVTCPALASAIGRLEASGLMREMTERLRADDELAAAYQQAHDRYLRRRAQLGSPARIAGISAGGMPHRVKCLHALVGHALAVGPGENPLGDQALAMLGPWWAGGPCVPRTPPAAGAAP